MPGKRTSKLEEKFVALKDLKEIEEGPGGFEGYVNNFGYLDDGGDIVLKGAYVDVIPAFLKGGFTANSHDWDFGNGAVGYPMDAREDDEGLWVVNKFHSTPDAQNVRIKARERMADGKEVGLSIGYRPSNVSYVYPKDYEKELPKYLRAEHLAEGLEKAKLFPKVRVIPKMERFKESSIVVSAMNQLSMIDNLKGGDEDDAGTGDDQHLETPPAPVNVAPPPDPAAATQPPNVGDPPAAADPPASVENDGSKAGARNRASDIKIIQKIHDYSKDLHEDVCGTGEKDAAELATKIAAGHQAKDLYTDNLAAMTEASPYQCFYAFLQTINDIDKLADAAEGTEISVTPEMLLEAALASLVDAMRQAVMVVWNTDDSPCCGSMMYYSQPPDFVKLNLTDLEDLGTKTLDLHSTAVGTAADEFAAYSVRLKSAVAALLTRINERKERRAAENRDISAALAQKQAALTTTLRTVVDTMLEAVAVSGAVPLSEPEDLTGELTKLRLQTEKLRTSTYSHAM